MSLLFPQYIWQCLKAQKDKDRFKPFIRGAVLHSNEEAVAVP